MANDDEHTLPECESENKAVTIYDVARCARVSVATVSRALNGSGYVSAGARARIEHAVRRLGYRPNPLAQALSGQRSSVWGLLAPELDDPYWSEVAELVDNFCLQNGMGLVVGASHWDAAEELHAARLIARYRPDGIILCTPVSYATIEFLQGEGISVVLRGNCAGKPGLAEDHLGVDQVVSDEPQAVYLLTRHLLGQGHRRIVFVGYGERYGVLQPRYSGYCKALQEEGLEPQFLPWKSTIDSERALQVLSALMAEPHPPTAFLAASEYMAIHTWDWLEACGIHIPEQASLVGYGNSTFSRLIRSGLTTIDDNSSSQTEQAIAMLRERIEGRAPREPRRQIVPVSLVVRGSTGPVPRAPTEQR